MKNIKRYALPVLTATLLSLSLSGCVGALIGGAAVGTKSAVDRRTTGAQTDDNVMALRVETTARSYLRQNNQVEGYKPKLNVVGYNRPPAPARPSGYRRRKNNLLNASPVPNKPQKACTTTSPLPHKRVRSAM